MAEQWEYNLTYVRWDDETKEWVAGTGNVRTKGLVEILNLYGADGWELVNVAGQFWNATGQWGGGGNVFQWAAFFKRRKP